MGYIRAEEILPEEIIEVIQQYADGVNIYIPRKQGKRIKWGEANHTREKLYKRDEKIYKEYLKGVTVEELAVKYYLSDKSIWRILRKMKNIV